MMQKLIKTSHDPLTNARSATRWYFSGLMSTSLGLVLFALVMVTYA